MPPWRRSVSGNNLTGLLPSQVACNLPMLTSLDVRRVLGPSCYCRCLPVCLLPACLQATMGEA